MRRFVAVLVGVMSVAAGLQTTSTRVADASEPNSEMRSAPLREKHARVPAGVFPRRQRVEPVAVDELVAERTEFSETWQNSDGSRTVRQYAIPRYFKESGSRRWERIDSRLVNSEEAGWKRSGANRWRVSFGPAGRTATRPTRGTAPTGSAA